MTQEGAEGTGELPLDKFDEQQLTDAAEMLLLLGHEARLDPKALLTLAMREERTRAALTLLPHQQVWFDFVTAHRKCVVIQPIGTSKTFNATIETLWLLGSDATARGAAVSASQGQAMKIVRAVADYIEQPELADVVNIAFPRLRRTQRKQDPWRQDAITVDRPPGIRDPSLVAVGYDGALAGARLSWIIVDDIYDVDNTGTPEALAKVLDNFDSIILRRLDPDGRCIVTNTPWAINDLTQLLQRPIAEGGRGWPTLIMSIYGDITLVNVDPGWDSPALRPSKKKKGDVCRLVAHDPDPEEVVPLWPEKFPLDKIEEIRLGMLPHRFKQQYECEVRDDQRARCKREWLERCLANGRGLSLVREYRGGSATVTGVDLAFSEKAGADRTAFVTIELLPDGRRLLLDVEVGQWDTPTVLKKIIDKQRAYNSMVMVENNGAQNAVLQFARLVNASLPIKAHTTGKNKANPTYGVESLFVELMNGAWIFPCDAAMRPSRAVKDLMESLLTYEPPPAHTPDEVMAMWFAREMARKLGDGVRSGVAEGIARSIMSR